MHELFQKVMEDNNLADLQVIAAAALFSDGQVENAVSLPVGYTEQQQEHFCALLCDDENTCLLSGIWWLSDGGYLDYTPEYDQWVYIPPMPPIPAFPNDQTLDILRNSVVEAYYGMRKPSPTGENEVFNAVIIVEGLDKEQFQQMAKQLADDTAALGIPGAQVTINLE